MIKLSSIPMTTTLIVHDAAFNKWIIRKKEDLLDSCYLLDKPFPSIYLASKQVLNTDLSHILSIYGESENLSSSWVRHVASQLSYCPETASFMKRFRKVVRDNPIYTLGEEVEIDIIA